MMTFVFWRVTERQTMPGSQHRYACHTIFSEPVMSRKRELWTDLHNGHALIDGDVEIITELYADPEAGSYPSPGQKRCYIGVAIPEKKAGGR